MEYELKAFELLVSVALNPNAIKFNDRDTKLFHKNIREVNAEVARIKMKFIDSSCQVVNEKQFELYVRQHQLSLIYIVDILFNYQQSKHETSINRVTTDVTVTRLYTELFETAEGLLSFVESRFYKYFDKEAAIPVSYRKRMSAEVKANIKYLHSSFVRHDLSGNLITVILQPFHTFLRSDHIVTFRELLFLKELQRKLFYLLANEERHKLSVDIHHLLLYLNYNTIQYFNFYISEFTSEAKQLNNMNEQIEFYSFKLKLINQQPMKPGFVSKPLLPSIKEQIGSWINEELHFLEKRQSVLSQQPSIAGPIGPKVHTSFSVANLSLAVKLLIDEKLITNINAAELMRMVARNFKTDKAEQISEDSLRNKSYNIEVATVDKMKDVIIGMMNRMKEY